MREIEGEEGEAGDLTGGSWDLGWRVREGIPEARTGGNQAAGRRNSTGKPWRWEVVSEWGWVGTGSQTMKGLRSLGRILGFLLRVLGSQGRVLSRGEEQICNFTAPLWLSCQGLSRGDSELVTTEETGGQGAAEAGIQG